jgi:membrane associated rhomboid family serine protease
MIAVLALLAFHTVTVMAWPGADLYPHLWNQIGAMQAGRVLSGEWWRLVTALTLHADAAHVLSNVAIGGAFVVLVCRELGPGLGLLLVTAGGGLGNLANAAAQSPDHLSVGFSTAVFAAAGMLGAMRAAPGPGGRHLGVRYRLAPVAAAMGLLALLGFGDARTDIGAHIFGFLAGLVLGAAGGLFLLRRGRPGKRAQWLLGGAAAGLVLAAWLAAFARA